MKSKLFFTLAFLLILCISWADVMYNGTGKTVHTPIVLRQIIHFGTLGIVCIIGFAYWRRFAEKWVSGFWLLNYLAIALLTLAMSLLFFVHIPLSVQIIQVMLRIRNVYISPLAFLIFKVFQKMVHRRKT
jgi:hypothetical protein